MTRARFKLLWRNFHCTAVDERDIMVEEEKADEKLYETTIERIVVDQEEGKNEPPLETEG